MKTLAASLLVTLALYCANAYAADGDSDLIGLPAIDHVGEHDTLLDMARRHDVGYVALLAANPGIDPWVPPRGTRILIPASHVLPLAPREGIVINLAELRLYWYPPDGRLPRSFPIGIGDEGKETPVGEARVRNKQPAPTWTPTASEHAEDAALPARIGPGPDNPMGDYALYLSWSGYAIHGTNKPDSIGRRDSHGCIRMYPEDIAWLYAQVGIGTRVSIVDQPVKLGWDGSQLYIEVHPAAADINAIERSGRPLDWTPAAADEAVIEAAGAAVDRVDWDAVRRAAGMRSGMPLRITN